MESKHDSGESGGRLVPSRAMREKFLHEVATAGLPSCAEPQPPIEESDVASLPLTAQRYLRFSGAIGKPRIWSFRARWTGRFLLNRRWLSCEAWQYNARSSIARIFHMRLHMLGVLPILVRDTYLSGKGRMLGRAFDTVSVVDEAGEKIDTGELVTYLDDAILFAPSMLLGPETTWTTVDDDSFDVALTDGGRTVRGRVTIDARGAVESFATHDRYGVDPARPRDGLIRTRWSTPVGGVRLVKGRAMPTFGRAVWHFASGDSTYAVFDFDPANIEFDVPPCALPDEEVIA